MAFLLHHLLTETAHRLPDKEAIRFNGDGISYAQLDALTNQLARKLQEIGVQRGERVGIFVPKSFASIINVFAILKAGAVYVPIDPNAPIKRIAYIASNCNIKVLLTSTQKLTTISQLFSEKTPIEALILTDNQIQTQVTLPEKLKLISWSEVKNCDTVPISSWGTIETDLAYILYTSGSTGDPKGVMISHRTIFTFINWCHITFQITEKDRITSYAPLHFDLSTFDIYVTIKAGGTLVLVPENLSIFTVRLADLLQNERITVTYLVPSILSLMVNYGELDSHDFSSLRIVLFAGEVFPIKYLRQLIKTIPHPKYYNLYGPTETNVCTYYKVQPKDITPEQNRPVPIGIACENIEVFALDDQGLLVTKPGQKGDLCVRGSCVAHGYWGDPEKTAKTFIPNPLIPYFHDTIYRTGDIVMLDQEGKNWIYIGRNDHMIKSRGYRIEIGEIEAALYKHPGVKEAVVVAIPDELISNRIVAFIVPMDRNGVSANDIKTHCNHHLPRFMVPESIKFQTELPKTSTGKINRQSLINLETMNL